MQRKATFERYARGSIKQQGLFFSRFSVKYGPRQPLRLGSAGEGGETNSRAPANALAADWTPILQQQPCRMADIAAWFAAIPAAPPPAGVRQHIEPVTDAEVQAAIAGLKDGKACGQDRLSNEFYRDNARLLGPLLASLFTAILKSGQAPSSFAQAEVYCIRKVAKPCSGLDCRPIALLNGNYKIFTRILATRLGPFLKTMIHETQNGFVPGRDIHDTIDILTAARALIRTGQAPCSLVMLLLDFQKANDSLDRAFLGVALEHRELPRQFVRVVLSLHSDTTATSLANGSESRSVMMRNGIRQGCPLAPLLFILALDSLFRRVQDHHAELGVRIPGPGGPIRVPIAGYADDAALYATPRDEEQVALQLVRDFGRASGLRLNVAKCAAVCLHPDGPTEAHRGMEIRSVLAHMSVRYLGIQVSSATHSVQVWEEVARAIQVRMLLGTSKTADELQRADLAAAIIMPKIAFVARHTPLDAATVSRLQLCLHRFVWTGWFDGV